MNVKYILINLFATPKMNEPVRLSKDDNKKRQLGILCILMNLIINLRELIYQYIERNFYSIIIALAFIIFIISIFQLTGLSAVESGLKYNHFGDMI